MGGAKFVVALPGAWHFHGCGPCKLAWGHSFPKEAEKKQSMMSKAHTCPRCGNRRTTHIYEDEIMRILLGEMPGWRR